MSDAADEPTPLRPELTASDDPYAVIVTRETGPTALIYFVDLGAAHDAMIDELQGDGVTGTTLKHRGVPLVRCEPSPVAYGPVRAWICTTLAAAETDTP